MIHHILLPFDHTYDLGLVIVFGSAVSSAQVKFLHVDKGLGLLQNSRQFKQRSYSDQSESPTNHLLSAANCACSLLTAAISSCNLSFALS